MDIWYELVIRELSDLNGPASAILKEAEEALLVPAEDSDEEQN